MNEQDVFQMYMKIFNAPEVKSICSKCREKANLSRPISLWQLGRDFGTSEYKVLFVGKTARGIPCKSLPVDDIFHDATKRADELFVGRYHYWSYTNAICKSLYGDDAWEKIAFTNLVKCNASDDIDKTDYETKENCIIRNKIFLNELIIINPSTIIFYTGYDYDEFLKELFKEYNLVNVAYTSKPVGAKNLPWWEFTITINSKIIRCLRVGHPERKKKDQFVDLIVNYIKDDSYGLCED